MEHTYTVALAGNPNVGKSTVFNRLTGLRQHTGNWPGKTVERAEGYFSQAGQRFRLVDLPGTYSLAADSPEEEVAGAFLQSGQADAVIVVVDASCLRRGLILALQLRQQTWRLVLCVNLMDEAARRGVTPQIRRLGQLLDVPVVATAARSGKGLAELRHQAAEVCRREPWEDGWKLTYVPPVEAALGLLETGMSRRRAVALLWGSPPTEGEQSLWQRAQQRLGALSGQALRDSLTASVVALAEEIGRQCVRCAGPDPHAPDRRLDRLLTSRLTGFPVMLLLLGLVFYLTIQGANAPSRLLSRWLTALEEPLRSLLAGAPWWVQGAVVDGIYRTVAWVVAVMLPPMVNQVVNLFKNTSCLYIVGGADLISVTYSFVTGASTGGAYAPAYIVCGVIFFVVCFPLSTLAARWEASLKERKGSVNANLKTANKKVELKEAA
mgnify:CR=1 FL=1